MHLCCDLSDDGAAEYLPDGGGSGAKWEKGKAVKWAKKEKWEMGKQPHFSLTRHVMQSPLQSAPDCLMVA